MKTVIDFLEGKKTYFVAIMVAAVAVAVGAGWIDKNTAALLYGLLGAGGIATLRAAVGRIPKVTPKARK